MTAILKMGESVTSKYSSQALNSRRGKLKKKMGGGWTHLQGMLKMLIQKYSMY